MPWIENISLADVIRGFHYDPGPNSLLIQIVDTGVKWPTPKHEFKDKLRLRFQDIEEEDFSAIQPFQASQIASALIHALDQRQNVVVHCHAGVCRSGAVVEAGIVLGFQDTGKHRIPNIRVKKMVLQALGLGVQY